MDKYIEIKDEKVQIKKRFKNHIYNAIPKRYKRYAGIDPYFVPIFGGMYWKRLEVALRLAKKYASQEKPKIGDFGCGFGVLIALLSISFDSQIIGIDTYPAEILKIAEDISNRVSEKRNHFFIRDSIENLSFKSKTFDLCFSLDVLEHVPNVVKSIKEIKRIIRKDGILIFSVPVEGQLLKIARETFSLGGRLRCNNPHWNGDIRNYHEFEILVSNNFEILKRIYIPNRLIAYDIMLVCKN